MSEWNLKLSNTFLKEIRDSLDFMPHKFPIFTVEPLFSMGIRKVTVDNYIIAYSVYDELKEVAVHHVIYGGRNINELPLTIDKARKKC